MTTFEDILCKGKDVYKRQNMRWETMKPTRSLFLSWICISSFSVRAKS